MALPVISQYEERTSNKIRLTGTIVPTAWPHFPSVFINFHSFHKRLIKSVLNILKTMLKPKKL